MIEIIAKEIQMVRRRVVRKSFERVTKIRVDWWDDLEQQMRLNIQVKQQKKPQKSIKNEHFSSVDSHRVFFSWHSFCFSLSWSLLCFSRSISISVCSCDELVCLINCSFSSGCLFVFGVDSGSDCWCSSLFSFVSLLITFVLFFVEKILLFNFEW